MTEHHDTAAAAASDEHAPPPVDGNAVYDGGIADFDASRRGAGGMACSTSRRRRNVSSISMTLAWIAR